MLDLCSCVVALISASVLTCAVLCCFFTQAPPEGRGHNRCNFALALYLCLCLVDCTYMQSWSPDLSNHFSWPYGVNLKAPKVAASKRVKCNSCSLLRLVRLWVLMNTAWVYLLFTFLQSRSTWTVLLCVHLFAPNVCFVVQQVWRFCSSAWYNPKSFQRLKCVSWSSPFLSFSLNIWLTVSKTVSCC